MGHVISLLQLKGGSSKTTTAVNIMMSLKERGLKAVLCDMDKEKPDAIYWSDNGNELKNLVFPLFESNPTSKINEFKKENDFIIIDTPPQFESAAIKSALVCDLAIIPCAPSALDINALQKAAECAVIASKPFRFLASRIIKNTRITKELINILKDTGESFNTRITNSVNIAEAQSTGQWVGSYKPDCQNHIQYKELTSEILEIFNI